MMHNNSLTDIPCGTVLNNVNGRHFWDFPLSAFTDYYIKASEHSTYKAFKPPMLLYRDHNTKLFLYG